MGIDLSFEATVTVKNIVNAYLPSERNVQNVLNSLTFCEQWTEAIISLLLGKVML